MAHPDKSTNRKNTTLQIPLQDYGTLGFDDGTPITIQKINDLKNLLKDTKCSWWTLPETYQKFIENHIIPKKDSWTLECFKAKSGIWHFDLPEFLTFQESLCNGTELALDYWFEELTGGYTPIKGEKLIITISDKPIDGYTTTISHSHGDEEWNNEANYYFDNGSGILLWLCPYLQSLFKCLPKKLWFKFETPDYLPQCEPQGKTIILPQTGIDELFLKNNFYGDYFKNKKEAPEGTTPGTWCHLPEFKYYLKYSKLTKWLDSHHSTYECSQLFNLLTENQQEQLLKLWSKSKSSC